MTAADEWLDFLRGGSDLHRADAQVHGFLIAPAADDATARAVFQFVAEVAVERDGQGYRVVDVTMAEEGGAYAAVRIGPQA